MTGRLLTARDVADSLGVNAETVLRWVRAFTVDGSLSDRTRSGQPVTVLTPTVVGRISLDVLRSRQARPETSYDDHLSEFVVTLDDFTNDKSLHKAVVSPLA